MAERELSGSLQVSEDQNPWTHSQMTNPELVMINLGLVCFANPIVGQKLPLLPYKNFHNLQHHAAPVWRGHFFFKAFSFPCLWPLLKDTEVAPYHMANLKPAQRSPPETLTSRGSMVRQWKPSPWSQAAPNQSPGTLSKWTVPAPLFGMRVKITTSWVCHGNEMKATNPVTTTWHMLCKCWFSFFVNKDDVLTVHTQTCMTLPLSANMLSFSRHVEQTNLSDAFKIEAQLN